MTSRTIFYLTAIAQADAMEKQASRKACVKAIVEQTMNKQAAPEWLTNAYNTAKGAVQNYGNTVAQQFKDNPWGTAATGLGAAGLIYGGTRLIPGLRKRRGLSAGLAGLGAAAALPFAGKVTDYAQQGYNVASNFAKDMYNRFTNKSKYPVQPVYKAIGLGTDQQPPASPVAGLFPQNPSSPRPQ